MSFFRRKSLFILLIGVIVLVLLIGYSMMERENVSKPEQFLIDVVGGAQHVIQKPVSFIQTIVTNIKDVKHTYSENHLLREKLAEYKTLIYEVQELEKENE